MNYKEAQNAGNKYRIDYRNDINSFISELRRRRIEESVQNAKRFSNNPDEERTLLAKTLGWPLTEYNNGEIEMTRKKIAEENGVIVFRVVFRVFSGIRYYGLLFQHNESGKKPLVICQHGGAGTPELCSSLLESGSSNYNDMTWRILSLGMDVFAPQMLIWDPKRFDEKTDNLKRNELDLQLKQCGSSIAALEIYCLRRSLDYLCNMPTVDPERIGMVGLSYGGFYTLYTAALDTRIKAAISCSFFNDRSIYSWSDWVWNPGNDFFFDPEVAMLVYPRAICIAVGEKDNVFNIESADGEIKRLKEMSYAAYKYVDWFNIVKFNGEHEFIPENDALKWLKEKLKTSEQKIDYGKDECTF